MNPLRASDLVRVLQHELEAGRDPVLVLTDGIAPGLFGRLLGKPQLWVLPGPEPVPVLALECGALDSEHTLELEGVEAPAGLFFEPEFLLKCCTNFKLAQLMIPPHLRPVWVRTFNRFRVQQRARVIERRCKYGLDVTEQGLTEQPW